MGVNTCNRTSKLQDFKLNHSRGKSNHHHPSHILENLKRLTKNFHEFESFQTAKKGKKLFLCYDFFKEKTFIEASRLASISVPFPSIFQKRTSQVSDTKTIISFLFSPPSQVGAEEGVIRVHCFFWSEKNVLLFLKTGSAVERSGGGDFLLFLFFFGDTLPPSSRSRPPTFNQYSLSFSTLAFFLKSFILDHWSLWIVSRLNWSPTTATTLPPTLPPKA